MLDRKGLNTVEEYQAAILDMILALMDTGVSCKEEQVSIINVLVFLLRDYMGIGQPELPLSVTMMLEYVYYNIILDYDSELSTLAKQAITSMIEYNVTIEYKRMITNGIKNNTPKQEGIFSDTMINTFRKNPKLRAVLNPRVDKEDDIDIDNNPLIIAKLYGPKFNTKL